MGRNILFLYDGEEGDETVVDEFLERSGREMEVRRNLLGSAVAVGDV